MGKIKIMAKMKLLGESGSLFLMFALGIFVIFICGNFSFLATLIAENTLNVSENTLPFLKIGFSLIGMFLFVIFASPMRLGREKWFLAKARGENPTLFVMFSYFNKRGIVKSVKAWCYIVFNRLFSMVIFFFPSICLFSVLYFTMSEGESSFYVVIAIAVVAVLLFLLGCIFSFVYSADLFLYYPIIVANDCIKPTIAIEKSREIVGKSIGRVCRFKLSFFPWWLLCVFIVPIFYVWGYYKQSGALLAYRNEML